MAKIRLGAVVAQVSGSIDGVTYSHNRNGPYARARRVPTNPRTAKQQAVRTTFQANAKAYRMLTQAQRTQWTALGQQMSQRDSLGAATSLTGLQAYVSVNQYRANVQAAPVSDAPQIDSTPDVTAASVTITAGTVKSLKVGYTGNGTPTQGVLIYATGVLSAGIQFVRRSQYRLIQGFASDNASPADITAGWQAVYGPLNLGQVGGKISVLLLPVSTNHIAGTTSRADGIITA